MNPLEKWCEKHNLFAVWLALSILPGADVCLNAIEHVRQRRDELLALAGVDIEQWASFYLDTTSVVDKGLGILFESREVGGATLHGIRQLIEDPSEFGSAFAQAISARDWNDQLHASQ